ncbi:PstS family phosphate ABC transporter substrate-binding protein [Paenibacillus sp. NPDC057967]|uniref:PstS family phosphate ABC transporter substrate-binding protein n=1 Tax=Paenibacillus sp. NPDC057967 TaxID=3346293 RepID=UPI0036DCAAE8
MIGLAAKESIWSKVLTGLFFVPLIWIVGFFVYIFAVLSGVRLFYIWIIFSICVVLSIMLVVGLGNWLRRKVYWSCMAGLLLVLGAVIFGYEMNRMYHNNIPTVAESEVDLAAYEPFVRGSKAVMLDEPSTLRIKDELPIMDGATALYPLYSAFAMAVYPEKGYDHIRSEVRSTKTSQAYDSLISGEADIIFAAEPSERQRGDALAAGVDLKLTPIGREAFVFFTHADNPVNGLTTEQIQDIYSGTITNWDELGGKHASIRAFQRPEGSGSQSALQRLMKGRSLAHPPRKDVASGMGGIIAQTADYRNYPNAIGFTFLYYATEMIGNGEIKLLSVDGAYPGRESIVNETYPLSSPFYAVTAGTSNPHVESLINWIRSEQGQKLVAETGYSPLAAP